MLKVVHCHECGEELKELEMAHQLWNGKYICEDCRDAYYVYCDDCHNLVHERSIMTADNGNRYICEICADQYYFCDHCEELCSGYNLAVNDFSLTLCGYCYDQFYFTCGGCGEVYHLDDGEEINGEYYCDYCADEYRDYIQSYSYKPAPVFYGGNAGYGIELEIDDGDNRQEAAEDIMEAGGDHIYLKEDGSLSYMGMEIVTHPASLNYHMHYFPWTDICNAALYHGYRSHDTDTCGLHIHASRELFGDTQQEQDLTIAKIMLLVDRWYESHIVRFSRRDLRNMKRWADKPNAGIRPEDNDTDAITKSKKHAGDRYRAINICNYRTVEFRFFRGTLKRDTIIASIQWIDVIIQYCRNTPLKDLFNATWDEIFGNTGYKELTNYLKQRNLYNVKEEI